MMDVSQGAAVMRFPLLSKPCRIHCGLNLLRPLYFSLPVSVMVLLS